MSKIKQRDNIYDCNIDHNEWSNTVTNKTVRKNTISLKRNKPDSVLRLRPHTRKSIIETSNSSTILGTCVSAVPRKETPRSKAEHWRKINERLIRENRSKKLHYAKKHVTQNRFGQSISKGGHSGVESARSESSELSSKSVDFFRNSSNISSSSISYQSGPGMKIEERTHLTQTSRPARFGSLVDTNSEKIKLIEKVQKSSLITKNPIKFGYMETVNRNSSWPRNEVKFEKVNPSNYYTDASFKRNMPGWTAAQACIGGWGV